MVNNKAMSCKHCSNPNSNDVYSCTKCSYSACLVCITDGCAPNACMACTGKDSVATRSESKVIPQEFMRQFREALTAATAAPKDQKVATMHTLMKFLWAHRFFILGKHSLRSVVTRKMLLISKNASKLEWIDRYPWIQGEARDMYNFFKWKPLPVTVGAPYRRVPAAAPAVQSQ